MSERVVEPTSGQSGRSPEGRGTTVSADTRATPAELWPLLTDIDLPARFSTEFRGARWISDPPGPALGASFRGRNANERMGEWFTVCRVTVCEPPYRFGWAVGRPAATTWLFTAQPTGGGSRLELSVTFGPGRSGLSAAVAGHPERAEGIITWRLADLATNMQATVDGIAALAAS